MFMYMNMLYNSVYLYIYLYDYVPKGTHIHMSFLGTHPELHSNSFVSPSWARLLQAMRSWGWSPHLALRQVEFALADGSEYTTLCRTLNSFLNVSFSLVSSVIWFFFKSVPFLSITFAE